MAVLITLQWLYGNLLVIKDKDIIDERYQIIRELGEGGFAFVYQAEDLITGKEIALKIIKENAIKTQDNVTRFEREARASASLNHPNIVKVVNIGYHHHLPYMASELIKGKTLRGQLDEIKRLSFAKASEVMYQLCEAVSFAHSYLVVHRDIKPDNVFMTPDEMVKLGDFGIAFFENAHRVTQSQVIIGSVHYLPPEVTNGQSPTFRSDIYSLGVTFFELITGRVPFEGNNQINVAMMHIKEKFPSPRIFNHATPKALEKIILKACRKNPNDRYRSVIEMQKDIKALLDNPKLIQPRRSFWAKLLGFKMED
jgi:eukaryotic-like serine/threonine-protein kinase